MGFRYNPGPDFEENTKDPLVDFSLTDSSELWLVQWPINQASISLVLCRSWLAVVHCKWIFMI